MWYFLTKRKSCCSFFVTYASSQSEGKVWVVQVVGKKECLPSQKEEEDPYSSWRNLFVVMANYYGSLLLCDWNLGYLVEIKDEVHFDKETRNIKEH